MAAPPSDTIFAPASGVGRAAVAVIRISGPQTRAAVLALGGALPAPRRATLQPLRDAGGELLDRALVLWFPGPASFTGEDAAEFQIHGGRAVLAGVLRALAAVPGCRPAAAGEFTRRALLNRKLDLDAVEGLADLIDAQTEAQRRQAQRQLDGALGRWVETLREDLLAALALAEGAIDFADEDDVVGVFEDEIGRLVAHVSRRIDAELAREQRGARLREGLAVAITGPPNAGKSTLLNALAGREVAIVSAQAGTTRDVLTVALDLDGLPVELVDTAGLRESLDPIEREGVARARTRAASADLVLWLHDSRRPAPPDVETAGRIWTVATKIDLEAAAPDGSESGSCVAAPDGIDDPGREHHRVSALTGVGLDTFIAALTRFAAEALIDGEGALVTRLRHRQALEAARICLRRIEESGPSCLFELVAEDLRGAATVLAGLVGRLDTEEVLGAIFARFCIGK